MRTLFQPSLCFHSLSFLSIAWVACCAFSLSFSSPWFNSIPFIVLYWPDCFPQSFAKVFCQYNNCTEESYKKQQRYWCEELLESIYYIYIYIYIKKVFLIPTYPTVWAYHVNLGRHNTHLVRVHGHTGVSHH